MINNLQNIASVGATQGEGAKASQAVAVQFPNISEQNQKSHVLFRLLWFSLHRTGS